MKRFWAISVVMALLFSLALTMTASADTTLPNFGVKVEMINDLEHFSAGQSVAYTSKNKGDPTQYAFYDLGGMDIDAKASTDFSGDGKMSVKYDSPINMTWKYFKFAFSNAKKPLTEYTGIIFWIRTSKAGPASEEKFRLQPSIATTDGQHMSVKQDSGGVGYIKTWKKGASGWEDQIARDDYGLYLDYGWEGYVRFDFDNMMYGYPAEKKGQPAEPDKMFLLSVTCSSFGPATGYGPVYVDSLMGILPAGSGTTSTPAVTSSKPAGGTTSTPAGSTSVASTTESSSQTEESASEDTDSIVSENDSSEETTISSGSSDSVPTDGEDSGGLSGGTIALIIVLIVLALGGIGAAAYFLLIKPKAKPPGAE